MNIICWNPKEHKRYKFYTLCLKFPFGKKWKQYWFCKRCNFINKPFLDAIKNLPPIKANFKEIEFEDFTWEIIR